MIRAGGIGDRAGFVCVQLSVVIEIRPDRDAREARLTTFTDGVDIEIVKHRPVWGGGIVLELAGGVRKGRQLKAVIPGGSSAPVLPADIMMSCTMDYDSIAKAGSMLGSGAVIVMDDNRSMVESLKEGESAG